MLKRIASIIMILCLAGLALAGCGGSENGNQAYSLTGNNCMHITASTLRFGKLKSNNDKFQVLMEYLVESSITPAYAFKCLRYGRKVSW